MREEAGRFLSKDGVTSAAYLIWLPDGPIKGTVQIVHGMCEYKERYKDFMAFLTDHGYACCIHDHLGHGETAASPEKLGYFGENYGWRYLVDDTARFCEMVQARQEHTGKPYTLFGHSMGSFIARLAAVPLAPRLNGAIFCGTAGEHLASAAALKFVDKVIQSKGTKYRPASVDKMMFGSYNNRFRPVYTGKEWLSRNAAVGYAFSKDPMCNFTFTAAAFRDLLELNRKSNEPHWFQTMDHNLPVYFIAGGSDPVGGYGKGVAQSARRLRKAAGQKADLVSLKLYPGARHELLNELNRKEVFQDILHWIEKTNVQV